MPELPAVIDWDLAGQNVHNNFSSGVSSERPGLLVVKREGPDVEPGLDSVAEKHFALADGLYKLMDSSLILARALGKIGFHGLLQEEDGVQIAIAYPSPPQGLKGKPVGNAYLRLTNSANPRPEQTLAKLGNTQPGPIIEVRNNPNDQALDIGKASIYGLMPKAVMDILGNNARTVNSPPHKGRFGRDLRMEYVDVLDRYITPLASSPLASALPEAVETNSPQALADPMLQLIRPLDLDNRFPGVDPSVIILSQTLATATIDRIRRLGRPAI